MVTAEEKGKVKVLTSARARQDGTVDPECQVTLEQVRGEAPRILKSHVEIGESYIGTLRSLYKGMQKTNDIHSYGSGRTITLPSG
jgi:hypothetical protein